MTKISELAAEEAARAEAEDPSEPEQPAEPEPEEEEAEEQTPEQPQPEPLTPEQVERRYKAAGKVAERYAEAVAKALGPELMGQLVPSPLDALPGFAQVDQHGQVEPSVKAQTLAFLSVEAPPEYRQNPETKTCDLCGGEGDLRTGAKRKTNLLTQCKGCNGLGYTDRNGQAVGGSPVSVLPPVTGNGPGAPISVESHGVEDPRVAELRQMGYTILEPIRVGG